MDDFWQPTRLDGDTAEHFLTCPLCGFDMCNLARCPACEYEFPGQLPGKSWLRRLFHQGGAAAIPPFRKPVW